MSEMSVRSLRIADARPEPRGFVPASFVRPDDRRPAAREEFQAEPHMVPGSDAFSQGFEEGQRVATEAFMTEREALLRLVENAGALQPEPSEELAMLVGETVYRLVTDIVGQVEIDRECLVRRAQAAAAMIAECDNARTLFVNPQDLQLLEGLRTGLTLATDASLARGDIRIDCSAGWIEHGTTLYLDALRSELGLQDNNA